MTFPTGKVTYFRAVSDVGGLATTPVVRDEYANAEWENRIDALMMVIWQKAKLITVDELRRNIEELGSSAYNGLTYYERWMHSITQTLIQRGVITIEELSSALLKQSTSELPAQGTAAYSVGAKVRVKKAAPIGHVRTPAYCRGHVGVIERFCGTFYNPEELAYGRINGQLKRLYRVRFPSHALWTEYQDGAEDTVDVEIYEHWLEPA